MGYGPAAGAKGGRAYIKRAVTESLRRLRTDYLDLYQIHTPDPVTPIDETITALDELVTEGKIRYPGHYITDDKLDRVEALTPWAQAQGVTLLDVAIGGLAAIGGCCR